MDSKYQSYVPVFIDGLGIAKNFLLAFPDKLYARDAFVQIDNFKNTLAPDRQAMINLHMWGQIEIDLLKDSDIEWVVTNDIDWVINQCDLLTFHK